MFTDAPRTFDVYKNEDSDDNDGDGRGANDEAAVEEKANELKKKLKMTPNDDVDKSDAGLKVEKSASAAQLEAETSEPTLSKVGPDVLSPKNVPKPGAGPDPNKPKCRKAKDLRKERALKKLAAKGDKKSPPNDRFLALKWVSITPFLMLPGYIVAM